MPKYGYFQGTKEQPFHLSVGAVLYNDRGEIAAHHFKELTLQGETLSGFVVLMRETMESGETIKQAVNRGLMEEFGAKGDITHYLGSYVSIFPKDGVSIEKTGLYFLVKCTGWDVSRRKSDDPEAGSEIVWYKPDELIVTMREQALRIKYGTMDESSIVIRAQQYLNKLPNR